MEETKNLILFRIKNIKIAIGQFFIDFAERRMTRDGVTTKEFLFWSNFANFWLKF